MKKMASMMCEVVTDIFYVIVAQIPWSIIKHRSYPFRRGFFCDDQTLMYPVKGNSVRQPGLIALNMLIPIFTILILEFALSGIFRSKKDPHNPSTNTSMTKNMGAFGRFAWKALCLFFIGYGINQTAIFLLKYVTGRLRPHFFDACVPNYPRPCRHQFYYNTAPCTSPDLGAIKNARLSFPSLFAMSSAYSMTFAALYLHIRARLGRLQSFKLYFEGAFLLITLFIAGTRVADYTNHWSDVIVGVLLGAFFGILFANAAVNNIYSFLDRKTITRLDMALGDPGTPVVGHSYYGHGTSAVPPPTQIITGSRPVMVERPVTGRF